MKILAIDQGTTSSRAIIFTQNGQILAKHQLELAQFFPQETWVEHDGEEIWQSSLECCRQVLAKVDCEAGDITALGISNQRETTLLWDRQTGELVYPAIVWQDSRTAEFCQQHPEISNYLQQTTGLLLDPYFCATKIAWLLNNVDGVRQRA